jgi:hypothetical protein
MLAFLWLTGIGRRTQISLNSGDLRHQFLGWRWKYVPLSEPERAGVVLAAQREPALPAGWVACELEKRVEGWRRTERRYRVYFEKVGAWSHVDPQIGRILLDELAHVRRDHTLDSVPPETWELDDQMADMGASGRPYEILPEWRDSESLMRWLEERGYRPRQ